jgi:hypothetical protein
LEQDRKYSSPVGSWNRKVTNFFTFLKFLEMKRIFVPFGNMSLTLPWLISSVEFVFVQAFKGITFDEACLAPLGALAVAFFGSAIKIVLLLIMWGMSPSTKL